MPKIVKQHTAKNPCDFAYRIVEIDDGSIVVETPHGPDAMGVLSWLQANAYQVTEALKGYVDQNPDHALQAFRLLTKKGATLGNIR